MPHYNEENKIKTIRYVMQNIYVPLYWTTNLPIFYGFFKKVFVNPITKWLSFSFYFLMASERAKGFCFVFADSKIVGNQHTKWVWLCEIHLCHLLKCFLSCYSIQIILSSDYKQGHSSISFKFISWN